MTYALILYILLTNGHIVREPVISGLDKETCVVIGNAGVPVQIDRPDGKVAMAVVACEREIEV